MYHCSFTLCAGQGCFSFGDPDAFAATMMEATRCYGEKSQMPVLGPDPCHKADQLEKAKAMAIKYYWPRFVVEEAAKGLALTPEEVEFIQGLFEFVFDSENLSADFSYQHQAGIAACVWFSVYKDKHGMDGRPSLNEGKVREKFHADLDYYYGWASEKVDDSFTKYKNRISRKALYARATARGKMVRRDIWDRATKEVCGRDVTGELRAEVYLA